MTIPRATYRLQLHREFGFDAVAQIAPYLAQLGISHVYTSPFQRARPGSTHGYDIVAHDQLNPELGDVSAFERMTQALDAQGLKLIADIVPNHMGVGGSDNPLWLDVLEWGEQSRYAGWFDIDWEPHNRYLTGKVLVPFLGDQYGMELAAGALRLQFDAERGEFAIWAYESHKLPVCPLHYGRILGNGTTELELLGDDFAALEEWRPDIPRRADDLKRQLAERVKSDTVAAAALQARLAAFNEATAGDARVALDALIQMQHWRACHFRVAGDDINYRRFFNVNELAGLRMELPAVFEHVHRLLLPLIRGGQIDGLRVDHIDGLIDPAAYLAQLRAVAGPLYLVVEKILTPGEQLPDGWDVAGTTGYEFCHLALQMLTDAEGAQQLTRGYHDFIGRALPFAEVLRESKVRVMNNEMAGELNVLARSAARIARLSPRTADFTGALLLRAIRAVVACLPVYRTYFDGQTSSEADVAALATAIAAARELDRELDDSVFDFLAKLLDGRLAEPRSGYIRHRVLRCAMRLQQYSGPVMAKGQEDTAFYRFNRFIAANEVGGNPESLGIDADAWHSATLIRAARWPHSMLASSTHDTKRGEDSRARLAVLSEIPADWLAHANRWREWLLASSPEDARELDPNDLYQLLQTLVGSCPPELNAATPDDDPDLADFRERVAGATRKSLREAKVHTSWIRPDEAYEDRVLAWVDRALRPTLNPAFWESFAPFMRRVATHGMHNSLVQLTLKLTAPGVPDLYQGCEGWNTSMVDPDNRRSVDYPRFTRHQQDVAAGALPADARRELLQNWTDGRIKHWLTSTLLQARRAHEALFTDGTYQPVEVSGARAREVCAFLRTTQQGFALIVVTLFSTRRASGNDWQDTTLTLPVPSPRNLTDALTGAPLPAGGSHAMDAIIGDLPAAVFLAD